MASEKVPEKFVMRKPNNTYLAKQTSATHSEIKKGQEQTKRDFQSHLGRSISAPSEAKDQRFNSFKIIRQALGS